MKASFFNLIKRIFWRGFLHPLIVSIYGWYIRGTISLQKRGILVHHPVYALLSRRHVHHAALIGISFLALTHTAMLQRVDEQEFLVPLNAISRLVGEDEEFIVETENTAQSLGKEYVPTVGLRSQPGRSDEQGAITPPPADPGTLAAIPGALIKPILPTPQTPDAHGQTIKTYTVKTGDTLGSIARAHGLRLATLLWANNLSERSLIRIGQRLIILPTDGIHYRVVRGDTLGAIARRYSADVEKILHANNLPNPNAIAIGELLVIPDGIMPTARPTTPRQQSLIARVRNVITPGGTSVRASSGFIWPTSARRITQYFGWRHTGVDIAGPPSNRIYAAADGIVSFAGWARGYGLSVVVDHGRGRQTRYAHSRQIFVKSGDSVSQGETIAMVGSTGRSTGPHLHFEVIVGGRRVNPFVYIR